MSRFDDMVAADNAFFLSEVGDSVTYQPGGNPANNKVISIIKVDEKPTFVPAASADKEFYQCEVMVSSRNDTEGQVTPVILGFAGASNSDKILNHFAMTWFVIDRLDDNDPSFNRLVLRTKAFPRDYVAA